MRRTLSISEELYARLEEIARIRGLGSVEKLLEEWEINESELLRRQETVGEIDKLRERIFAKYGEMADSTELLREDRDNR